MLEEIAWAEDAGLATAWVPQVPSDMDALQMVALLAAPTARIELGTAVVPLQAQHPVALARQALSAHAIAGGRLTLGVGPSHHWIVTDMLGLPYDKPGRLHPRLPRGPGRRLAGDRRDARSRGRIDVENEHVHRAQPVRRRPGRPAAGPHRRARPGHAEDRGRAAPTGPCCGWPTSARSATTSSRRSPRPPRRRAAPLRASSPASRSACAPPSQVDEAQARANRILGEAEISPNYQRILEYGDARDIGDLCAAGDEAAIAARFRRFADAGVTDLSVRLLPIGNGRDELIASKHRTREVLAGICAEFQGSTDSRSLNQA